MALNRLALVGGGITALLLAVFCLWFNVASDYDPPRLAGTYVIHNADVSSTLNLQANQTFTQTRTVSGQTKTVEGSWRRMGEGGVVFSANFLRLPGQRSSAESPGSDDTSRKHPEYYGHFEKILTVYPKLSLDGGDKEVVLHRRLF